MRRLDVAIAAAFAVYAAAQTWVLDNVGGPALVSGPLLVAAGVALAWRRSHPLASATGVAAAVSAQALLTMQAPEGLVVSGPVLFAAYGLGAHGAPRDGLLWLPAALGATAAHTIGDPLVRTADDVSDASFWWLAVLAAWLVGLAVHRHRQARDLRAIATELERERDEAAARERTRMARELHDVVSHGVSVIALQAGAAQESLTGDPERTRERLLAIEQTARDSAAELRRMLGVLRDDGDGGAPRGALPRLDDLPSLVEALRAAGLPVALDLDHAVRDLPSGVQLSAYRVVQEGLTNVVKHAQPSRVDVAVRRRGNEVEVRVADDGAASAAGSGGGFGLAGLRERVDVHGGTLDCGPREGGGFELRACLPATPS